jgi:2,3-dihydroxybenzoate-AMP ligase
LLGNRSRWMCFRTVSLPRWHHENVVLIGDAAHTAHYSVGSGTKMALEDAIALADSLSAGEERPLADALRRYEVNRRPRVEALQDAAVRSQRWWDSIGHRLNLPAPQLMLAYLSRGGVVSASRLAGSDPGLLRAGLAAFADAEPTDDELADVRTWVLNRPYEGAAFRTSGRVLDEDGQAGYREVPGDPCAVVALRAANPEQVLVAVLGTDVDDPWSPAADEVLDRCFALAEAGADGVRLDGRAARPALLDRLALAERIRLQSRLFTVVSAPADHVDDLVDGVVAGRIDLVAIADRQTAARPGIVPYPVAAMERYVATGAWGTRSLPAAFREAATIYAERTALITPDTRLTYRELDARSDAVAARLLSSGLLPGERVLLQLTNSAAAIVAWYGLLKAGLIPVCTLAIHRRLEIEQIGRKTGAVAHLVQADFASFDLVGLAQEIAGLLPAMRQLITVGATPDTPGLRIEDLQDHRVRDEERVALIEIAESLDAHGPAVLQLSGGTTGTPKIIPRLHAEYRHNADLTSNWWGHTEQSVLAFGLPLAHNAALTNGVHAAHGVGAALLLATPAADVMLPLMAEHGATWTMCPPGLAREYLSHPAFDAAIARLDTWVLTAARVPRPVFDELTSRGVHVTQAFGMSEGLFLFTPLDAPANLRAQTVGIPISSLDELRVLRPGTEIEVAVGETGELAARGPYTIRGYLAAPDHDRQAFTTEGFYRSGDLVRARRYAGVLSYSIEGRVKDLIDRGGEKVNAEEVELLVAGHPAIAEIALVGMPDPRLGERGCAYVVPRDPQNPPTLADICTYLETQGLAKYKWPERLELIEALPRTQVGKISKVTLRADIAAKLDHEPPRADRNLRPPR